MGLPTTENKLIMSSTQRIIRHVMELFLLKFNVGASCKTLGEFLILSNKTPHLNSETHTAALLKYPKEGTWIF